MGARMVEMTELEKLKADMIVARDSYYATANAYEAAYDTYNAAYNRALAAYDDAYDDAAYAGLAVDVALAAQEKEQDA